VTPRDLFVATMHHESVDRLPVLALEPFEQSAIERWHEEGLPEGIHPVDFLGMSRLADTPVRFGPMPAFEQVILSEDDEYIVKRSDMGALLKVRKENPTLFYGHIDHPVKTAGDWEKYKLRFNASSPGRFPKDWEEAVVPRLKASTDPIGVTIFPFFFRLGFYAMGMERFLTAFYDEPDLMHDMFAHWSRYVAEILERVLDSLRLDYALFAEDLAGKNGPLVSPRIYEHFWHPYQDPIVQLLRDHDVPVICQWSAGEFEELLPTMLDHGFTCTWPLEAMAGMDAPGLRLRHGSELLLGGNIAKEAVIAGPQAIDREVERLMPLIREGGFLPALDDMASPDMPFSHYSYLIRKLQGIRL
jgi:hypothetical protein